MIKFQGAIFLPTHGLINATCILDYTAKKNDIHFVMINSLSYLEFMNEEHYYHIKRLRVLTFFLFTVHVSTLHNVILFYKIEICH